MSDHLALTLPLRPQETAYSFVSRLAARNSICTRESASDMGVVFGTVVDTKCAALERLAHLSGAAWANLMAWSLVRPV
ncbi:TniQ family protein [Rhodobacter sp. NSM]|uniref:TniQ family protein n=1 Tax=Rhodobacter sp. NSM TaxID=3457501 RepID=UPI003FD21A87